MRPSQCLQPAFRQPASEDFMLLNNNNNHLPAIPQFPPNSRVAFPQTPLQSSNPQIGTYSQNNNVPIARENIPGVESPAVSDMNSESCTDRNYFPGENDHNMAPGASNFAFPSAANPVRWKDFNSSYYAQNATATSGGYRFTFTSPTQSHMKSTYSPSLISTSQNRYQSHSWSSQHTFAPTGCSAPWQHSAPVRIHWSNAGLTSQAGLAVFTGMPTAQDSVAQISTSASVWSSPISSVWSKPTQQREPVPSCSKVPRRPKRHSSQNWEYMCPTSKVHLTEEMIAKHLEELRIHGVPAHASDDLADARMSGRALDNQRQWQNFKDLEEKLEISDDESTAELDRKAASSKPKLHILEDINLKKLASGLPEKLFAEIQKPRLEVVLWTPPGDHVKQLIKTNFPDTTLDTVREETANVDTDMAIERPIQDASGEEFMVEMSDLEPMDDMIDL